MTFSKFSDSNWASWAKILIITALSYAIESLVPALGASMLAILLGMALSAWRPPASTKPAKQISGQLLKIGIVFLGFGLSFAKLQAVGLKVYLVLIPVVAVALLSSRYLGRWMGIESRSALLVGMGTAICGGSAIAAAAPIVEAEDSEIAFAITTIFLYNTLALFLFPLLGAWLGYGDQSFGLFAGAAINDTSSVVAAGFAFSESAGTTATIVKMARTLLIVPVCLGLVGARYQQASAQLADGQETKVGLWAQARRLFPSFIAYFLLSVLASSLLPLPAWLLAGFKLLARLTMIAALAGVGLAVDLRQLRRAGSQSIILGGFCWSLVIVTASLAIHFFYS